MSKRTSHNKLNLEGFLERAKNKHGDTYGYERVVYTNSLEKVEIYCKNHKKYFWQTPKSHYRFGCNECGRERQIESAKMDKEDFIKRLKEIYGDKYNTSKLEYINTKTEVTLVCRKHGDFIRRPSDLLSGLGCKKCKLEKSKYNNVALFIEESIKLFGDITDHSKVKEISANSKADLTCLKHDVDFRIIVSNRLGGQKCPKCAEENYNKIRTLPLDIFYKRCNKKHNNKYTYTNDYKSAKDDITFYCDLHGLQTRNAYSHMHGAPCRECRSDDQNTDRLGKEGYVKLSKGRDTTLYLIHCWNEEESFYKLGKTFRGIGKRFTKRNMPYSYTIISEYASKAGEIWELENVLHKKYKNFNYKTNISFDGHTECYNLELPIEEIINLNNE